jgi:hypothetical protein
LEGLSALKRKLSSSPESPSLLRGRPIFPSDFHEEDEEDSPKLIALDLEIEEEDG